MPEVVLTSQEVKDVLPFQSISIPTDCRYQEALALIQTAFKEAIDQVQPEKEWEDKRKCITGWEFQDIRSGRKRAVNDDESFREMLLFLCTDVDEIDELIIPNLHIEIQLDMSLLSRDQHQ